MADVQLLTHESQASGLLRVRSCPFESPRGSTSHFRMIRSDDLVKIGREGNRKTVILA